MGIHYVLMGVADWRQPNLLASLYPEDMPADWQLAYYSTRFPCVWLPYPAWSRLPSSDVAAWVDDTRAEFRFLLEPGMVSTPDDELLLRVLAPRFGGFLRAGDPDLRWFDSSVDMRDLSMFIQRRVAVEGVTYLLSRDGDMATLDKVGTLLELLGVGPGGRVG